LKVCSNVFQIDVMLLFIAMCDESWYIMIALW